MIRIRLVATGLSLLLTSCAVGATQAPATGNAPAFAPRTEWQVPSLPPPLPITAAEYAQRRERLAAAMEEDRSIRLVPGPVA